MLCAGHGAAVVRCCYCCACKFYSPYLDIAAAAVCSLLLVLLLLPCACRYRCRVLTAAAMCLSPLLLLCSCHCCCHVLATAAAMCLPPLMPCACQQLLPCASHRCHVHVVYAPLPGTCRYTAARCLSSLHRCQVPAVTPRVLGQGAAAHGDGKSPLLETAVGN